MEGWRIPAEMLACLDADGLDGREHVARQYTASIAQSADLVICMTAEHRTLAVREAPFALRRTFMLSELVEAARGGCELSGDTVAERLASLPSAVADFRPSLTGVRLADVPDPYRRSQAVYDACYSTISEAVAEVAAWVRG